MPITLTTATFTDATTMDSGDVQQNLSDVRAWLNGGIPTADVTAASLSTHHFARPLFYGFPYSGQYGLRVDLADAITPSDTPMTQYKRHRQDMFVTLLSVGDITPITGKSRYIRANSAGTHEAPVWVYLTAWCWVLEMHDPDGDTTAYPDAAGKIVIAYRRRESGSTWSVLTGSTRNISTGCQNHDPDRDGYSALNVRTGGVIPALATSGVYDFVLAYQATTAAAEAYQVMVGNSNLTLRVSKEGY